MTAPARPADEGASDAAAPRARAARPLLELHEVGRTYGRGATAVQALSGVGFTIGRGEMVAIMGPSGSGKTTLMNILGCLDRPSSGRYLLAGRDVSRLDADALADIRNAQLGFVFQGFNLLARTSALDNVALPLTYGPYRPARERLQQARRCLERVGLAQRAHHMPNELSGGEQQRVAIARALVNDPPLVLADEPTGNLDTRRSEEILALLQELNGHGLTVVMVTHEPDIAACCSRVLRLRDGRLVADEPIATRWLVARAGHAPPPVPQGGGQGRGLGVRGDGSPLSVEGVRGDGSPLSVEAPPPVHP